MAEIYMTVKHRAGVGYDDPLPIRERSGRHASSSVGHAVCLMDWALLLEIELERWSQGLAGPFTAYPHGIDQPSGYGFSSQVDAVNSWMPFWGYNSEWLDPAWTPVSEWFDDAYGYDLFGIHGLRHSATRMTDRRLRRLDDLRRYYYDIKRMTRIRMLHATVTTTGAEHGNIVNAYGISGITGQPYSYDDITGGSVSVDYSRRFAAEVVSNQHFSGTIRWVLGRFRVNGNGLSHTADYYDLYKTVWMPVSGTSIDISNCTSGACRAILEEEMPKHKVYQDEDYFCQFVPYTDRSYRHVVICDLTFPSDSLLGPWRWEPTD